MCRKTKLNVTLMVESTAPIAKIQPRQHFETQSGDGGHRTSGLKASCQPSVNEQNEYVNNKVEKRVARLRAISVFSEDTAKVNQLVAAVQQDARLESQNYGLTTVARRQYELQLTEQAIRNFQQQAQHIATVLGARNYKIVEMNVGNVNINQRQPRMYASAASANMKMADAGEVANDMAGETEISVNVSGSIQCNKPFS